MRDGDAVRGTYIRVWKMHASKGSCWARWRDGGARAADVCHLSEARACGGGLERLWGHLARANNEVCVGNCSDECVDEAPSRYVERCGQRRVQLAYHDRRAWKRWEGAGGDSKAQSGTHTALRRQQSYSEGRGQRDAPSTTSRSSISATAVRSALAHHHHAPYQPAALILQSPVSAHHQLDTVARSVRRCRERWWHNHQACRARAAAAATAATTAAAAAAATTAAIAAAAAAATAVAHAAAATAAAADAAHTAAAAADLAATALAAGSSRTGGGSGSSKQVAAAAFGDTGVAQLAVASACLAAAAADGRVTAHATKLEWQRSTLAADLRHGLPQPITLLAEHLDDNWMYAWRMRRRRGAGDDGHGGGRVTAAASG